MTGILKTKNTKNSIKKEPSQIKMTRRFYIKYYYPILMFIYYSWNPYFLRDFNVIGPV